MFYPPSDFVVDSHYANLEMSLCKRNIVGIQQGACSLIYLATTPFDGRNRPTEGKQDVKWVSFTPIPASSNLLVPYPGDHATKESPTPRIMVYELNDMIKNGALDSYIRADSTIKFTAVSYTHLDVYKRQG